MSNALALITGEQFYTYMHCRKTDGKVFYIGKGKGKRAWQRHGRSQRWHRTAAKHGFDIHVCAKWASESDALAHEIFLIDTFRHLEHPLTNLTDGGEGISGFRATPEQRAARSAAQKLREQESGRQSRLAKQRMSNEEFAKRIHAGRDQHFSEQNNRDAVGKRISAYYSDPANKAAHAQQCRERLSSSDARARMSRQAGGRPLVHEQTGIVYASQGLASQATGISQSAISNVLHRKKQSVRGQVFTFIEEENE